MLANRFDVRFGVKIFGQKMLGPDLEAFGGVNTAAAVMRMDCEDLGKLRFPQATFVRQSGWSRKQSCLIFSAF
jgi:hypothetical protein